MTDTLDLDPVLVVVSRMEYGVQPFQHAQVGDDSFKNLINSIRLHSFTDGEFKSCFLELKLFCPYFL